LLCGSNKEGAVGEPSRGRGPGAEANGWKGEEGRDDRDGRASGD
jgi:hypothetical protein